MFTKKIIGLPINKNYRHRILIDLIKRDKNGYIMEYKDNITNNNLLCYINLFISIINKYDIKYCIHALFQKSFDEELYGLIIAVNEKFDKDNINIIQSLLTPYILAINIYNRHKPKNNDMICYFTKDRYFKNGLWYYSMSGFSQMYPELSKYIHVILQSWIRRTLCENYFGLGGESLYYTQFNKFKTIRCLTDCDGVHEMNIYNNEYFPNECHLIDYNKLIMKNYMSEKSNILVINISRKGLRNLNNQIINLSFDQIIYIGCCQQSVTKDVIILQSTYKIIDYQRIQMFPNDDNNIMYLINLIDQQH